MHLFVTLQLVIDYKEMVEQRRSQGSSQGKVSGNEGLLELFSWVILVKAQNKAKAPEMSKRS